MHILLYLAIIPVIFLLRLIYNKDREKESTKLLAWIFIFGALSVIPIIFFELVLEDFYPTENIEDVKTMIFNVFISIALVEEVFKFFATYIFTRFNKEFQHRYDAIVYCVFGALGFALIENIMYVFSGGIVTALLRAVLSIPSHCCDAVIMGLFYGLSQEKKIKGDYLYSVALLLIGILIPSIEHALYDGLIFLSIQATEESLVYTYIGYDLAMVVITYIICFIIVKKVAKIDTNFDGTKVNEQQNTVIAQPVVTTYPVQVPPVDPNSQKRYCIYCGTEITSNFCPNCGSRRV